jgi:hypothetical protein
LLRLLGDGIGGTHETFGIVTVVYVVDNSVHEAVVSNLPSLANELLDKAIELFVVLGMVVAVLRPPQRPDRMCGRGRGKILLRSSEFFLFLLANGIGIPEPADYELSVGANIIQLRYRGRDSACEVLLTDCDRPKWDSDQ